MNDSTREFEGAAHGHGVGLSLVLSEARPGEGPELHRHPYDEVHVVDKGRVLFVGGGARGVLGAGDIIVVPRPPARPLDPPEPALRDRLAAALEELRVGVLDGLAALGAAHPRVVGLR